MFTERFFIEDYNSRIFDVIKSLGVVVTLEVSGEDISFSGGKPVKVIGYKKVYEGDTYRCMDIEGDGVYYIPYDGKYVKTLELPGFELRSRDSAWKEIGSDDLGLICDRIESGQYTKKIGDYHREVIKK